MPRGRENDVASRSPHPYHRTRTGLTEDTEQGAGKSQGKNSTGRLLTVPSSSDSGTEADDERGRILKSLPAPPLRPHKGLRDAPLEPSETPHPSPFGTPLPIDEKRKGFDWQPAGSQKVASADLNDNYYKTAEQYSRRKRRELARRVTETALFLSIGFLASCNISSKELLQSGYQNIPARARRQPFLAFRATIAHFTIVTAVYLSYPILATFGAKSVGYNLESALRRGFHIPSIFDPAPLLYPVLLPLFVSFSLHSPSLEVILSNIVLGIASLPPRTIPLRSVDENFNLFHWSLTLVPTRFQSESPRAYLEVLSLLYPLQCCLLHTVEFLTTTSLDVAELHLLATALVNLYLFAGSAQSQILKALLWLGVMLMFVFCKKLLQWEVALARIPAWRFRQSSHRSKATGQLSNVFDSVMIWLLGRRVRLHLNWKRSESSDEESDQANGQSFVPGRRLSLTINGFAKQKTLNSLDQPRSTIQTKSELVNQESTETSKDLVIEFAAQRRHTLAATEWDSPPKKQMNPRGRPKRSLNPLSQPFTGLTRTQAAIRKWAYAGLVYSMVLLIILGPIRSYVSIFSLQGSEPFGWALGYLLGDVPFFRSWISTTGFDFWVPIPPEASDITSHLGWYEMVQGHRFGLANTRLLICAYCFLVLLIGVSVVMILSSHVEVDTRRKVFHGTMVAILLPTVFIDPCFISLALSLILSIFLLLDLFRACQLPPISRPLTIFLAPYVDGRDYRGPVIISHIFLLIGCAIPLWLSLAGLPRTEQKPWAGWTVDVRDVSMVSGVICVGMGDSAASLIGRRYGRHKWYWGGGKSLEGSLAFAAAVTMGLMMAYTWLRLGGWSQRDYGSFAVVFGKASAAALGASLTEAVLTGANDNVVVPVMLWLLVRGLGL